MQITASALSIAPAIVPLGITDVDLPDLRKEALTNIKEAIRLWLEVEAEDTGLKRVEQAVVIV